VAYREPLSDYRRAARMKWPEATVKGDGPWALLCQVTQTVTLYFLYMWAAADAAKEHSNWQCAAEHRLIEIKPLPLRKERPLRYTAEMERD